MREPVKAIIIHHPLPLLCRLWHSWGLDHHTWGWDYYQCKRCAGRKVIGPPGDEADVDQIDWKWLGNNKEVALNV
jgi:hypothetical protein